MTNSEVPKALDRIAQQCITMATEMLRGEIIPSDDLRLEARRLLVQAENMDQGL